MKRIAKFYITTFKGLSKEIWWLSLITLINRAGAMVIPFLSLYLTKSLGLSFSQVGWIMSAFGLGSMVGSWIGGKLTDIIGYYRTMTISLLLSGVAFITVQTLTSFSHIAIGIFVLMVLVDTFRPAMFVAVSAYSRPENKTRSITLIRLAINLGFSAGPAIGGFIIVSLGYSGLFWIDGLTCILAGLLLFYVLHPRKSRVMDETVAETPESAYKDKHYLLFLFSMALFGIVFLQYFSTMPIYYKEMHGLNEDYIGLLLAMNGVLICILEMPLVKWLEDLRYSIVGLMIAGGILTALSFVVLNMTSWAGVLIIGMLFMTFGEMITFPFSNVYALKRSKRGKQGQYMALYSITFSISHVFGHNSGLQLVDTLGYELTWSIMVGLMSFSIFILIWLARATRNKPI